MQPGAIAVWQGTYTEAWSKVQHRTEYLTVQPDFNHSKQVTRNSCVLASETVPWVMSHTALLYMPLLCNTAPIIHAHSSRDRSQEIPNHRPRGAGLGPGCHFSIVTLGPFPAQVWLPWWATRTRSPSRPSYMVTGLATRWWTVNGKMSPWWITVRPQRPGLGGERVSIPRGWADGVLEESRFESEPQFGLSPVLE